METVEVDGLRIAYERVGQGPALVLFHGAGSDSRLWRPQLEGLSDEFTVFAWDAPGCGQSDDPAPGLSAEELGAITAGFLRAAVPAKPHLLGLSWGSMVALEVYRGYPGLPASLVLTSAYAGWAGSLPPEEVERRYAQVEAEIDQPPEKFIDEWLPTLFTDKADPAVVAEASRIMAGVRPAGLRMTALRQRPGRLPARTAHHQHSHAPALRRRRSAVPAARRPRAATARFQAQNLR